MKLKITLLLIISICLNTVGQSPEALAKYHFLEAQNAYGNGDNSTALTNLESCVESLGKTNSKIEALYTYIYFNKEDYVKAKEHSKLYFKIASEDHSDYMKMISLVTKIKEAKQLAILEKEQDIRNWEEALSKKTTSSFENYLQNPKNLLYANEAKKYLEHISVKILVLKDKGDWSEKINYNIPIEIEDNQWDSMNITDFKYNKYYLNVTSILGYKLPYLPKEIGSFINLKKLETVVSNINVLPESIGKLINLEELKLKHSSLTKLPESIGNLVNLKTLSLSYTKMTILPESIGKLINLKSLIIANTPIEEILPKSFGNLVNLEELHLYHNFSLTKLPESIGNLVSLKTLILFNSKITLLPESIGNLVNLKTLNLYNSEIKSLPKSIGNLLNLKTLDLGASKITSLPESISNINNLQILLSKADSKRLKKSINKINNKNKTIKFVRYYK